MSNNDETDISRYINFDEECVPSVPSVSSRTLKNRLFRDTLRTLFDICDVHIDDVTTKQAKLSVCVERVSMYKELGFRSNTDIRLSCEAQHILKAKGVHITHARDLFELFVRKIDVFKALLELGSDPAVQPLLTARHISPVEEGITAFHNCEFFAP
eukprot:6848026-Pyramimonas_sp.AAC.1